MPRVNITGSQNDLGVRVGFDQFFGEGAGGPVANSLNNQSSLVNHVDRYSTYLAVSQKLIPLLSSEFSHTVIFGGESIVPHQAVRGVLDTRSHHMVALNIPQPIKSLAEGYPS
jgi:hypothetical protein